MASGIDCKGLAVNNPGWALRDGLSNLDGTNAEKLVRKSPKLAPVLVPSMTRVECDPRDWFS